VRRGAGTAVPCPYMGGLIVGRLVRRFDFVRGEIEVYCVTGRHYLDWKADR